MARPKKEAEVKTAQAVETTTEAKETEVKQVSQQSENSEFVDKILKHYPQYEKAYVSSQGFVHPENSPKYVLGDAKLYKNKYYKQ